MSSTEVGSRPAPAIWCDLLESSWIHAALQPHPAQPSLAAADREPLALPAYNNVSTAQHEKATWTKRWSRARYLLCHSKSHHDQNLSALSLELLCRGGIAREAEALLGFRKALSLALLLALHDNGGVTRSQGSVCPARDGCKRGGGGWARPTRATSLLACSASRFSPAWGWAFLSGRCRMLLRRSTIILLLPSFPQMRAE